MSQTDQRTRFLIQVLEKIGGPLTGAATILPSEGDDASRDAKHVAELLNRSVQLGLSVAEGMNVRDEAQADGVHLALAAFAAPLVAGQFMLGGRVPGDLEIRRLSGALQAVLTFADNFTPAADHTLRLENLEAGSTPADEALVHIQMLTAFGPVFQVVTGYSFGRPENKLIQEVAGKLVAHAAQMREEIFGPDLPLKTTKQVDLVLLKVLAGLYAAAHAAETQRLMALGDEARMEAMSNAGGVSMDAVWSGFDKAAEMARIVAEQIVPDPDAGAKADIKVDTKAAAAIPKTIVTGNILQGHVLPGAIRSEDLAAKAGLQASSSVSAPQKPAKAPDAGAEKANPMAFFLQKKDGEGEESGTE